MILKLMVNSGYNMPFGLSKKNACKSWKIFSTSSRLKNAYLKLNQEGPTFITNKLTSMISELRLTSYQIHGKNN